MAVKLKDATDRYEVLERERRAEQEVLKKAVAEAKDARSAMRAMKKELLHQAKITLRLGPFQPQMSHDILHGKSGQPVQLSPLSQPIG